MGGKDGMDGISAIYGVICSGNLSDPIRASESKGIYILYLLPKYCS